MFERFTNQARRVVVLAQEEARMLDHNYIGTEHLLLGLLHEGRGSAARALQAMDVTLQAVRDQVIEIIGRGQAQQSGHIPFTPRAKKSLELSLREALQLGDGYIGTGHLLLGLFHQGDNVAVKILGSLGADLKDLRVRVTEELRGNPEEGQDVRPAEREQQRVGVHGDHGGAREPVEQPHRERAGAAAEVEDQRVRAPGPLLDRVDQGREPVLAIRQALLLLAIPALDPVQCGVTVKFRHARASLLKRPLLAKLPWTVTT